MYRGYPSNRLIWYLIIANTIIFMATIVSPRLFFLLGLQPIALELRPWTIVTNLFVHSGFGHIFTNMLTLYFFGTYLLRLLGTSRLLIIYFGGGVLGNILLLALAPVFPFSIAVGASGAIFALGGTLTMLSPRLKVFIFPLPVAVPLWVAVVGGFFILSFVPGVAWQAHLGGLLFGLVFGYLLRQKGRYY